MTEIRHVLNVSAFLLLGGMYLAVWVGIGFVLLFGLLADALVKWIYKRTRNLS